MTGYFGLVVAYVLLSMERSPLVHTLWEGRKRLRQKKEGYEKGGGTQRGETEALEPRGGVAGASNASVSPAALSAQSVTTYLDAGSS